eukprot:CAMPEP_0185848074 /NCGR_PEP_ID=MMETSP1354-20130828/3086_1 /TAXON_ID=708628 /ORGANISM="Erythrolobus madagascarensis, Strain CCMP3276" /LENGTH=238 /DNA_ID=CAMNT_0028548421 /DNA_START=1 /DNA_END=714 /DNA_ORIENTATION=+
MQRQQNLQEYLKRAESADDGEDGNTNTSGGDGISSRTTGRPEDRDSGAEKRDEDAAHVAIKTLVDMLELVWQVTTLDIQSTADDVALKVLSGEDLGEKSDQDKRDTALPVVDFMQQQFRGLMTNKATPVSNVHAETRPSDHGSSTDGWSGLWNAMQTSWSGRPALGEGERARTRAEILNARAAGLRELGMVFVREGRKVDATEELLKALGIEKAEAEVMEKRVRELEEQERELKKKEK